MKDEKNSYEFRAYAREIEQVKAAEERIKKFASSSWYKQSYFGKSDQESVDKFYEKYPHLKHDGTNP
jgi:hypothetical protein